MLLSEAIAALAVATIADGRSLATVEDYRQKLGYLLAFLGRCAGTRRRANDAGGVCGLQSG